MIDLNHCYLFVRLADAGSFTKAAELLKKPKSRVSRALSALEQELGVQLIHRTTRQFQLSEAGSQFYAKAKVAIEGLELAVQDTSEVSQELRGTIRLTAPEDVGVVLLPPLIDTFRKMHSLVQFEIILSNSVLNLTKEAIDVAIRIGKLSSSGLKTQKLGMVSSCVVAAPDYAWRLGALDKPEDLSRCQALVFGDHRRPHILQLHQGKKTMSITLQPKVMVNNFFMLRDLVMRGQGFAEITRFIIHDDLREGKLVRLLPDWETESVPISLVTLPTKHKATVIKAFTSFLSDQLRELFR